MDLLIWTVALVIYLSGPVAARSREDTPLTDAIVALIEAALSSPWGLLGIAVVATVDGFSSRSYRARASSSPPVPSPPAAIKPRADHRRGRARRVHRRSGVSPLRRTSSRRPARRSAPRGNPKGRRLRWAGRIPRRAGRHGARRGSLRSRWTHGGHAPRREPLASPLASFSLYDGIAAVSWATYAALVGHLGGAAFEEEPLKGVLLGLGLALALAGAIELLRHVRRRHPDMRGA